jgi:hypothetical protein
MSLLTSVFHSPCVLEQKELKADLISAFEGVLRIQTAEIDALNNQNESLLVTHYLSSCLSLFDWILTILPVDFFPIHVLSVFVAYIYLIFNYQKRIDSMLTEEKTDPSAFSRSKKLIIQVSKWMERLEKFNLLRTLVYYCMSYQKSS